MENQTKLTDEVDTNILCMFALGISYSDMRQHVSGMYCLDVSQATMSSITGRFIPDMKEWQQRPLDEAIPIQNCNLTLFQLAIYFGGRLDKMLDI